MKTANTAQKNETAQQTRAFIRGNPRHNLGTGDFYISQFVDSMLCYLWCREGGSNPHEVALGGF